MFLETLFQSSFMFWCSRQRFDYKYVSVVIVTIIMSILSPVLAFVLIGFTEERGYARILGYSFVYIGIGLVLYIINCKKGKKFFTKKYWKYALSLNLPLIIYYLSQMLFNQSDRLMIKLTDETFEKEVLKSDVPVLVDFHALWCGPCRMLKPVLEELSAKYRIVSVDVNV